MRHVREVLRLKTAGVPGKWKEWDRIYDYRSGIKRCQKLFT
jgi:hypothetical protein